MDVRELLAQDKFTHDYTAHITVTVNEPMGCFRLISASRGALFQRFQF